MKAFVVVASLVIAVAAVGDGTSGASAATATQPCIQDGSVPLDCPNLTNKVRTVKLGSSQWDFNATCNLDYNPDGRGIDIVTIITNSFHDCIQACASYNQYHGSDACFAVHFEATDLDDTIANKFGNCWLKNSTGKPRVTDTDGNVSARLVSSLHSQKFFSYD